MTSTNRRKHPTSPHFHCWLSVDHILGRHHGSYSTFLFLALQPHAEQSRHSNCYPIAFFSSTLSSTCLPLYTRWPVPLSALYLTSTSPAGHAPRRPRDLSYDTSSQARKHSSQAGPNFLGIYSKTRARACSLICSLPHLLPQARNVISRSLLPVL